MADDILIRMHTGHRLNFTPQEGEEFPFSEDLIGLHFAIAKRDIPRLAEAYFRMLDIALTDEWCKCEFVMHPDDVNLDKTRCRFCKGTPNEHPSDYSVVVEGREFTKECLKFSEPKSRKHKVNDHPHCPVHTHVGRLLGFYEWLFPEDDTQPFGPDQQQLAEEYDALVTQQPGYAEMKSAMQDQEITTVDVAKALGDEPITTGMTIDDVVRKVLERLPDATVELEGEFTGTLPDTVHKGIGCYPPVEDDNGPVGES